MTVTSLPQKVHFAPGQIIPTIEGRWVFFVLMGEHQQVVFNYVHFYVASMAEKAMHDMVAKLNKHDLEGLKR